jgi:hypothetical protein
VQQISNFGQGPSSFGAQGIGFLQLIGGTDVKLSAPAVLTSPAESIETEATTADFWINERRFMDEDKDVE